MNIIEKIRLLWPSKSKEEIVEKHKEQTRDEIYLSELLDNLKPFSLSEESIKDLEQFRDLIQNIQVKEDFKICYEILDRIKERELDNNNKIKKKKLLNIKNAN